MARIRTIKPEFWTSLTISALPAEVALTFIGLWNHCDDYGRCLDESRLVKAAVHPLRDAMTIAVVESHLQQLEAHGLIVRYESEGRRVLQVRSWEEHQKVEKRRDSRFLPPPCEQDATTDAVPLRVVRDRVGEPSPTPPRQLPDASPPVGVGGREEERDQGSSTRSPRAEGGERSAAVRLTVAANQGITKRFGEQPVPLMHSHRSSEQLVESLHREGVPIDFAVAHLYRLACDCSAERPPRSVRYFERAVIEAWHAEQAHRLAATTSTPVSASGRVVGAVDAFTAMAIKQAQAGDVEWIAECERLGVSYAEAVA
jgi:hypothetical protein